MAAKWFPLDPSKADYRATFGAYVAGCTLLELAPNHTVVVGTCSAASREDAERMAYRSEGSRDKDRFVSRRRLRSWRLQP